MIGILEIVFTFIISCLIWFVIFKVIRKVEGKKLLKNIEKGIERQDKKFFTDGKEINLKKQLGLEDKQETGKDLEVPIPSKEEVAHTETKEEKIKSKVMFRLFNKTQSLKKKLFKHKNLDLKEHKELILEENKSPNKEEEDFERKLKEREKKE